MPYLDFIKKNNTLEQFKMASFWDLILWMEIRNKNNRKKKKGCDYRTVTEDSTLLT